MWSIRLRSVRGVRVTRGPANNREGDDTDTRYSLLHTQGRENVLMRYGGKKGLMWLFNMLDYNAIYEVLCYAIHDSLLSHDHAVYAQNKTPVAMLC